MELTENDIDNRFIKLENRIERLEEKELEERKRERAELIAEHINEFLPYYEVDKETRKNKSNKYIGSLFNCDVIVR